MQGHCDPANCKHSCLLETSCFHLSTGGRGVQDPTRSLAVLDNCKLTSVHSSFLLSFGSTKGFLTHTAPHLLCSLNLRLQRKRRGCALQSKTWILLQTPRTWSFNLVLELWGTSEWGGKDIAEAARRKVGNLPSELHGVTVMHGTWVWDTEQWHVVSCLAERHWMMAAVLRRGC